MGLTRKQQAFINEYLHDFNATQAAIRAGYSERTARQIGSENLSKPYIADAISALIDERAMSADEVLDKLAAEARADMADFLRFEDGVKLPFLDLKGAKEKGLLHLVRKFKYNAQGYPEIELYDAHAARELLGKHHGLFKDQIDVSGTLEVGIKTVDYRSGIEDGPDADRETSGEDESP